MTRQRDTELQKYLGHDLDLLLLLCLVTRQRIFWRVARGDSSVSSRALRPIEEQRLWLYEAIKALKFFTM